ncbi:molybdopterin cofactor-binding domain-containing protein [Candidatus Neomarinimicrobiota bacterium]
MTKNITRRDFIKYTGLSSAGIAFGLYITSAEKIFAQEAVFRPNIWLQIDKNGFVTITMHRSEMGQKVWTALPMIIAEELEADWSKVKVVQGDLNDKFGSQVTGGSASVRTSYDKLRKAGATAREMLLSAAAIQWGVSKDQCKAENGFIVNIANNEKLGYGQLINAANNIKVPENPPLKDPKDFKIIGKSKKSLGQSNKIDGTLKYGFDLQFPDMLTAIVIHCPVIGGAPISFDKSETLKVPGVKNVFKISTGVAIVGKNTWSVIQGQKKLNINWDLGSNQGLNSTDIRNDFKSALEKHGKKIKTIGDFDTNYEKSYKQIEALYEGSFLDHATMEPMNCTVKIENNNCELWLPTQDPAGAFEEARNITGFKKKDITIHTLKAGGGFGRRLAEDYVREAVEIAMIQKGTVKVIRTREEDIKNGVYRPATINMVKGAIDKEGQPIAWFNRISGPDNTSYWTISGGADELPYEIPNIHLDYVQSKSTIPIGPMRAVGNIQNAFVNESFIDELAHLAKKDPLDYRLKLMTNNKRQLNVLKTAAEAASWNGSKKNGKYYGLASHYCFQSYAAMVAEISFIGEKLKIDRMICAIDCGLVINPDGVKAQIEGGIAIGLSAALFGEITFKDGQVEQSNFHNYKLINMDQMPVVETHIISSYESPTGAGEPPVPPTAPALTNAIFAGTGKRYRSLPLNDIEIA